MRAFRLCVAYRHADGALDAPVQETILTAQDAADAIAQAMRAEIDVTGLRANALYIVDDGALVVWSLRLADLPT